MTNHVTPSQLIAKELKAIGITNKQVSVTMRGGSVQCWIKDFTIHPDTVEAIAKKYENISYCHASGEILAGGNRFVFVSYHHNAEMAATASDEYKQIFQEVLKISAKIEGNQLLPFRETEVLIGSNHKGSYLVFNLGSRHCSGICHNQSSLAWSLYVAHKNGSLYQSLKA